jgi:uncharacterized protein (TIGR04222 family)
MLLPLLLISLVYAAWAAMLLAVRRRIRRAGFEEIISDDIPDLDWAELAYLGNGPQRVFEAAAVWYIQNGYGDYDPTSSIILTIKQPPEDVHRVVQILQAGLKSDVVAYKIGRSIASDYVSYFKYLEGRKLVVPWSLRAMRLFYSWLQFFVSMAFFACGVLLASYYFIEPERTVRPGRTDSPGFVAWMATVVCGAVLYVSSCLLMASGTFVSRRLSKWGYGVLKAYQKRQWPNRRFFQLSGPVPRTEQNLALAVALFGLLVLRHTPLAHMMQGLAPPSPNGL